MHMKIMTPLSNCWQTIKCKIQGWLRAGCVYLNECEKRWLELKRKLNQESFVDWRSTQLWKESTIRRRVTFLFSLITVIITQLSGIARFLN
jgi:hypothetical protein